MPRRPKYLDHLPPHWRVELKTRPTGKTAGRIDKLYIHRTEENVKLRSIVKVLEYEKGEKLKEKRAKLSKSALSKLSKSVPCTHKPKEAEELSKSVPCTHKPKEAPPKVGDSTGTEGLAVLQKLITTLRKKAETLSALPAIIRRKKSTVVLP